MSKHIPSILAAFSLSFALAGLTFAQETAAVAEIADTDALLEASVTNAVDEVAAELAAAEPSEFSRQVALWQQRWKQGGRLMWVFAVLSILGLGCALERFFTLRIQHVVPKGFTHKVVSLWKSGDFEGVRKHCAGSKSMLARVVETMLEHNTSRDYEEVKMFAEDKAGRELRLENRKASMLALVASISPLVGLFGTMVALLGAFMTVAAAGEMGNPAILADDIAFALITTIAGLAIAMPALFCYNIIKNRLALYAVILEEEVSDLVNNLFIKK